MNKQIVVIRCKGLLRSEELDSLEEKLRKEYETGFMFVPCYCEVFMADEVAPTIERITRGLRPQSEWKRDNDGKVFCSNCGVECAYNEEGLYSLGKFCHRCGAYMRKGDES